MRADKFTVKTREALVEAQQIASKKGQSELTPDHILLALLEQEGGVVSALLTKIGTKGASASALEPERLRDQLQRHIDQQPRASGSIEVGISRKARDLIETAEKEAESFKDEFTSTEHFLLAVTAKDFGFPSKLLRDAGVTHDTVMQALSEVRGSQRVTDQDPEGKYQALERYTRDITDLARKGKLDPVVGRDEEIRRVLQILLNLVGNAIKFTDKGYVDFSCLLLHQQHKKQTIEFRITDTGIGMDEAFVEKRSKCKGKWLYDPQPLF